MNKILLVTNYFPLIESGEDIFLKEEYSLGKDRFVTVQKLIKNSSIYPKKKSDLLHLITTPFKYFLISKYFIKKIRFKYILSDFKSFFKIIRIVQSLDRITDTFKNIYTYWNDEYTLAFILIKKFYKKDIKVITRIHGIDYVEERHKVPILLKKLVYLESNLIVSQCKWSKKYLEKTYNIMLENHFCLPIGVQINDEQEVFQPKNQINFASCSNLIELKNIDFHIRLLSKLAFNNPTKIFNYHIIGSGDKKTKLEQILNNTPSNLNVVFHGYIKNFQLSTFYRDKEIDYLIHLSKHEGGIPLAIQEALSFGLIVICSTQDCLTDLRMASSGIVSINLNDSDKTSLKKIEEIIFFSIRKKMKLKKNNLLLANRKYNSTVNSKKLLSKLDEVFNC